MQFDQLKRRNFITLIGGAVACPFVAHAQQPGIPVIAFINGGSAEASVRFLAAFHKGLAEVGFIEGQNVAVEYHWLNGKYDRMATLVADVLRRRVASRIDPVRLGLVASLARPGGNATGINFFRPRSGGKTAAAFARHGAESGRWRTRSISDGCPESDC
jgi:putative ABC transport system substrate-binding protein